MDFRKDGDPLDTYLRSDTSIPTQEERYLLDGERGLTNSLKYIQSALKTYGLPGLGDLFSASLQEVKKTVDCVYALLQQRQKDLSFRSDIYDKVARVNAEKEDVDKRLTAALEANEALKRELAATKQQLTTSAGRMKQERDKLQAERDEARREVDRFAGKEKMHAATLLAAEKKAQALTEKLQKLQGEKDLQFKNHLEIVRPLHSEGPALFSKAGDVEFSYLVTRGFEESQNRLLSENLELRTALEMLQKELSEMLKQRREAFLSRLRSELGEDAEVPALPDLQPIRPEFFAMPAQEFSGEVVAAFQDNLRRFRSFLEEVDARQSEFDPSWELLKEGAEGEIGKVKSLSQLNDLLKQYRVLVHNQENIVQRVALGSKTKPPESVHYAAARLQLTSDKEIEQANHFLQDEFVRLEQRQKEMEEDKLAAGAKTKQLDEDKVRISVLPRQKQREHLMDERAKWEQALLSVTKLNSEMADS